MSKYVLIGLLVFFLGAVVYFFQYEIKLQIRERWQRVWRRMR